MAEVNTMEHCMNFFLELIRKYENDEMGVYGAQASFFTILAAFPFFMLLLALIDLIPLVHVSDLLSFLVDIIPDHLDPLVISVLTNIRSDSPGAILSVSAVLSIWSASKGMLSIERGLNRAYGVQVERNYFLRRLICSGYTFLFTVMCAVSLLFRFSSFLILILLILTFYVALPHKKQSPVRQFPGALFATLGWGICSTAFSVYFDYWGRFTVTYGSLTAVVFLMLWLYFCICILFIGAEINCLLDALWRDV